MMSSRSPVASVIAAELNRSLARQDGLEQRLVGTEGLPERRVRAGRDVRGSEVRTGRGFLGRERLRRAVKIGPPRVELDLQRLAEPLLLGGREVAERRQVRA